MIWTADTVMYRGESMYAAYSGDTMIWSKPTMLAKPVTLSSQLDTSSTYVLVFSSGNTPLVGTVTQLRPTKYHGGEILTNTSFSFDSSGNLWGGIECLNTDILFLKLSDIRYISSADTYTLKTIYTNYANATTGYQKSYDNHYLAVFDPGESYIASGFGYYDEDEHQGYDITLSLTKTTPQGAQIQDGYMIDYGNRGLVVMYGNNRYQFAFWYYAGNASFAQLYKLER